MADDGTNQPVESQAQPEKPIKTTGPVEAALPPVEAPSAAFILQLFLIPLLIVGILIMVYVMIHWLAHVDDDPRKLVQDLRKLNDGSWTKAVTLSDMLRDPNNRKLKNNAELAQEVSDVLEGQLQKESPGEPSRKMQVYLCRALGEFHVTTGLPVLIQAATETDDTDMGVQYAALEGIAVLAGNLEKLNSAEMRENSKLLDALLEVTARRDESTADQKRKYGELRSKAAFALGVLGGDRANGRLAELVVGDAYPNTRFNAATGLARHGDPRCISGLFMMLDPSNQDIVEDLISDGDKDRKRVMVMVNGCRAAQIFASHGPSPELDSLQQKLQALIDEPPNEAVKLAAIEANAICLKSMGKR